MRRTLERWLTNTDSNAYYVVSDVLAFFTILSITTIVLETVPSLSSYHNLFLIIEWVAVVVFTAEYIGRLLVARPTLSYIVSFYGLIDLVSVLPTYLGLGNFTFLKSARAIRIVRLLRMVRLAKMKHLSTRDIEERMSYFTINVLLLLAVLICSTLFVGTLIYLVEGDRAVFESIPLGMLWAFKVFLIGIPVAYPESVGGEAVHIIARLVGLTVFGVLVGVVGNFIRDLLFSEEKRARQRRRQ